MERSNVWELTCVGASFNFDNDVFMFCSGDKPDDVKLSL